MKVISTTARAYLQPLTDARSLVANALRKICPKAGDAGVNVLFSALLLVVVFAAGTLAGMRDRPGANAPTEIYKTALSETHYTQLSDGSEIHLAPLSQLSVQFATNLRSVTLEQGEAYFEVKHDEKKPFQVRAGNVIVRDLGTRFTVRTLSAGRLEVTVSEGAVALFHQQGAAESALPRAALQLSPGQSALVKDGRISVRSLSEDAIEAQLAWRERRFTFENEPLSRVVEDLNRFSPRKIVIDDPSIAAIEFGGSFRVEQVDLILEQLPRQFGIQRRVVDRGGGVEEIHLSGGPGAGKPRRDPQPQ